MRLLALHFLTITYLIDIILFVLYLSTRFSIIAVMKETLSFKIDPAIKDAILKLAKKENRSLSNYVVTVLMRHLEIKGIDWRKEAGEKEGAP